MESFKIEIDENFEFPVIRLSGYFAIGANEEFQRKTEELFNHGKYKIILDVGGCKVINSPGVTIIMDLTLKLTDDFKGKIVIVGLNPLKESVFQMVGVLPIAHVAKNFEEAKRKLQEL